MNVPSDEQRLRSLMQRLRADDERHVPAFHDLLRRPATLPERRPMRRVQVAMAAFVAVVLVIGLWLVFPGNDASVEPGHRADAPGNSAIDFERLHSAIDEHFAAFETPEWTTPSDSLLAIQLDALQEEESW